MQITSYFSVSHMPQITKVNKTSQKIQIIIAF